MSSPSDSQSISEGATAVNGGWGGSVNLSSEKIASVGSFRLAKRPYTVGSTGESGHIVGSSGVTPAVGLLVMVLESSYGKQPTKNFMPCSPDYSQLDFGNIHKGSGSSKA